MMPQRAQQGSIAVCPVRRGVREHVDAEPAVTVAQTRVRLPASSDTSAVTQCVPADSAPVVMVMVEPPITAAPETALPSTLTAILLARTGYLLFSMVAPESAAFVAMLTRCRGRIQLDRRCIRIRHRMICAQTTIWSRYSAGAAGACAGFVKPQTGELLCAVRHACRQLLPASAGCSGQGAVSSLPSASANTAVSVPAVFLLRAHSVR